MKYYIYFKEGNTWRFFGMADNYIEAENSYREAVKSGHISAFIVKF